MRPSILIADPAERDIEKIPLEVVETLENKISDAEKNLKIGASPEQTFNKRMSGNMHPALQMNLGGDYRAWFIEGKYIEEFENDRIYCVKVLTKKEAKKLSMTIPDFIPFLRSVL